MCRKLKCKLISEVSSASLCQITVSVTIVTVVMKLWTEAILKHGSSFRLTMQKHTVHHRGKAGQLGDW